MKQHMLLDINNPQVAVTCLAILVERAGVVEISDTDVLKLKGLRMQVGFDPVARCSTLAMVPVENATQ